MWISSDIGISKIEITPFTTVAASTAGTYLKIKDIICGFVQTSCGVWIENACFLLAITATKRRNVLYDSYLFEAQLHYFVFLSFPRLPHFPNSSPVFTSVFVLRLVARPDREFSHRICDKCRKFRHKQFKEICPKARRCSKVNVPLYPNIPQQFPCSLKVI